MARDLPGAPDAGPAGAPPAGAGAGAAAAAAVLASTRSRSTRTCWRLIAEEPRLMPHLHLSLQAGDDLILKRMKRRHCRADAIALAAAPRAAAARHRVRRRPDRRLSRPRPRRCSRTACALVEECGLAFLHVFPYSARARHAGGADAAAAGARCGASARARLRAAGDAARRPLPRPPASAGRRGADRDARTGRGHGASISPPVRLDGGARPARSLPLRITGTTGRASDSAAGGMTDALHGAPEARLARAGCATA